MATYRYVVYDIYETLKETFDDSELRLPQIIYWVQVVANNLRYQHLKKKDNDTGDYLTIVQANVSAGNGYKYLTLPTGIYDLDYDKGIDFITYDRYSNGQWLCNQFQHITPSEVWRIKSNPYECPSPSNPYFYRVGSQVHLLGIDSVTTRTVWLGLYQVVPVTQICDLDSEIGLNEEHLVYLRYQVLELCKFGFTITPERYNEGSDITARLNALSASNQKVQQLIKPNDNQDNQQQQ